MPKAIARQKRIKKQSKEPVAKLKNQCDTLVKTIIKIRDGNICQKCLKLVEGKNCQGSHVIPVSAGNKLRWEEANIKTLCFHCHMGWWHKNPMEAAEWFKTKFPGRWLYLQENRGIQKMYYEDFLELRERLQERLAEVTKIHAAS